MKDRLNQDLTSEPGCTPFASRFFIKSADPGTRAGHYPLSGGVIFHSALCTAVSDKAMIIHLTHRHDNLK
jgi:hypothetical protein